LGKSWILREEMMPEATTTKHGSSFAILLREIRKRAGLTPSKLASYLNGKVSLIKEWEAGSSEPPLDPAFYERFRVIPGFSDSDIALLLEAAEADRATEELGKLLAQLSNDYAKLGMYVSAAKTSGKSRLLGRVINEVLDQTGSEIRTSYSQIIWEGVSELPRMVTLHFAKALLAEMEGNTKQAEEEAQDILIKTLHVGANIRLRVKPEIPLRIHYPHKSVPDHAARLVGEGKWEQVPKQVVYQRDQANLFIEALDNPDHKYRQQAIQLVRRFNAAVEKQKVQALVKDKGILMGQASRKYGIPATTLSDWAEKEVITVLHRGQTTQGIYLDEEAVARAAPVYHEAKQQGAQAIRRLRQLQESQQQRKPEEKVVEPKLITLKGAEETYGVPYETLRSWYRSGHLPLKGREVFHTHGGGKILVNEQDVIRLKNQPPARGKPPIKPTE
jgi:transcriptional regulator with XRE-family HTH domain